MFYLLPELECMKYIEINLPVLYFNKTKTQNEYVNLFEAMASRKKELNIYIKNESINFQAEIFFIHLDNKKQKGYNDKVKCDEIFERLQIEFWSGNLISDIEFK